MFNKSPFLKNGVLLANDHKLSQYIISKLLVC